MTQPAEPNITWASNADAAHLIPLLAALYQHNAPDVDPPTKEDIIAHVARLLDPATPHRLAIAWDVNGKASGLAAVAIFVSVSEPFPDRSRQMELKELFVLPAHRSKGVGLALMEWIEARALEKGVCRIDWHVRAENGRGISFYEKFGANIVEGRLSMRRKLPKGSA